MFRLENFRQYFAIRFVVDVIDQFSLVRLLHSERLWKSVKNFASLQTSVLIQQDYGFRGAI